MFNKIKNIFNYIFSMGMNWFFFRIKYYFQLKYNYFIKDSIKIIKKIDSIELVNIPLWLDIYENVVPKDTKHIKIANNASIGKVKVFSNEYLDYGIQKKYHYNPITKVSIDSTIHWSKLPDFGILGDIKIPWELSRFPHFYSYIKAHKITQEQKYIDAFKDDILEWLEENKFPNGINFKCGQEVTFRVFVILISFNYFKPFLDSDLSDKIIKYLLVSGYRIEENLDYAVISVKNDHAISESIGLVLLGLLFQEAINDAGKWLNTGRKVLLNELEKQVYMDGSYLCHSFIYQREVLDELSFLLLILKKNFQIENSLIKAIKLKNIKMTHFLYYFTQKNGFLPNYGSNDGANIFPVSEDDYRDFRCSLNFASVIVNNTKLFEEHNDLLDLFSLKCDNIVKPGDRCVFEDGGYYILKNKKIFSFIRCHSYRDRPSQNDMMHLDVWYKGENILCDSGTYSYNTDKKLQNNFSGVIGHNTIMINDSNQMESVFNFGYANWTKAECLNCNKKHFLGKNSAYKQLFNLEHIRDIKLNDEKMIILDNIKNISKKTNIKQIWNTKKIVEIIDKFSLKVGDTVMASNVQYKLEDAYISNYYNEYSIGSKIVFEVDTSNDFEIKTTIEFKGIDK